MKNREGGADGAEQRRYCFSLCRFFISLVLVSVSSLYTLWLATVLGDFEISRFTVFQTREGWC